MADTLTQYNAYFEYVFYKNMPYKLFDSFLKKKNFYKPWEGVSVISIYVIASHLTIVSRKRRYIKYDDGKQN